MASSYKDHLYALILAGGGGTRLWPTSREKTPKQFLRLFNNRTLTQITAHRFNKILPWERIFIVTVSNEYKKEILKEIPEMLPQNIVVEPARRETGPAHGIGALYVYKKDPEAVIMTEAADRLVKPVSRYLIILKRAAEMAYKNRVLVAIGVEARYPHVGLGHIKRGKLWKKYLKTNFYKVDKFVEKPPLELAIKYTRSGKYYWNAGQYVWRARDYLDALREFEPLIYRHLLEIEKHIDTPSEKVSLEKHYQDMPKISVDYAVAERAKNLYVVASDFFWTDIGDWKEVWENSPQDNMGNVIFDGHEEGGEVINIDTSDALIQKDGRLIAVIDVDNIVIVDTKDALLICSKSRAQNVKQIVEKLKEKGKKEYL